MPSWSLSHKLSLWVQFSANGIFLAVYQLPALPFAWAMPPSFALWVPGCPLYQIMPCRLADLAAIFLWFTGLALLCPRLCVWACVPSGSLSRELLPPALPFSFVCFFFLFICLHDSPFCLSLLPVLLAMSSMSSRSFMLSFHPFPLRCSLLSASISLDSSLPPLCCSSVALFIHSHSLPCCHFCLFAFCAFWSSFIWAF